jgi:hypothetical protein
MPQRQPPRIHSDKTTLGTLFGTILVPWDTGSGSDIACYHHHSEMCGHFGEQVRASTAVLAPVHGRTRLPSSPSPCNPGERRGLSRWWGIAPAVPRFGDTSDAGQPGASTGHPHRASILSWTSHQPAVAAIAPPGGIAPACPLSADRSHPPGASAGPAAVHRPSIRDGPRRDWPRARHRPLGRLPEGVS